MIAPQADAAYYDDTAPYRPTTPARRDNVKLPALGKDQDR
jgi:hypothetical protein